VYQNLIDRTRQPLDLKQLRMIFGQAHRPHHRTARGRKQAEMIKTVQTPGYDLTVCKAKWRRLTLKI